MNNVDLILDQSDADDVRSITSGVLRFFSDKVWAGRNLDDFARFRLWATSTAARARLIELADVQRIKSDVAAARWANVPQRWVITTTDPDAPVGEIPPTLPADWRDLMGATMTARIVGRFS